MLLNESAVEHRHSRAFRGSDRHVQLRDGQLIDILRIQSKHPISLLLLFSSSLTVSY